MNGVASDPYAIRDPTGSDLYVDFSAGSDGTGTLASPWKTLSIARVQSVSPGQQLVGRNSTGNWPDMTSSQDGTSANHIVVRSYPGETCTFTQAADGAAQGGGDYWDFYRIAISCLNTGIKMSDPGENTYANYVRWIDCTGTRSSNSVTDNSAILYFYGTGSQISQGHEVIRGTFTGVNPGSPGLSNASLLFFNTGVNCKIIGCLLDGSYCPVYFKHAYSLYYGPSTPWGTVKNNIIRNGARGFMAAANYVTYSNNVFDNCGLDLSESGGGDRSGGNHCTLSHNTHFRPTSGYLTSALGMYSTEGNTYWREFNRLSDNVFSTTSTDYSDNPYSINGTGGTTDWDNDIDYSAVSGASTPLYYRNGSTYTMAAYKAAYPTQEVNGEAGTVTFVGGAGGGGTTPANWALAGGSIGKNNGSDGTDRGVDSSKLLTVN